LLGLKNSDFKVPLLRGGESGKVLEETRKRVGAGLELPERNRDSGKEWII
jgi:hypothetical protein